MTSLLHAFANDAKVQALVALVALDLVLGVSAALLTRTFRLDFVADFLRADVLGKLVPYFGLWGAVHLGGDLNLPGTSFGLLEEGAFALAAAALAGSVLGSLQKLGLTKLAALEPQTSGNAAAVSTRSSVRTSSSKKKPAAKKKSS